MKEQSIWKFVEILIMSRQREFLSISNINGIKVYEVSEGNLPVYIGKKIKNEIRYAFCRLVAHYEDEAVTIICNKFKELTSQFVAYELEDIRNFNLTLKEGHEMGLISELAHELKITPTKLNLLLASKGFQTKLVNWTPTDKSLGYCEWLKVDVSEIKELNWEYNVISRLI